MSRAAYDVIVAGGGTAGAIAAVAAARGGARTCLIEAAGHLGGTCHALANVTPFHNSRGEPVVRGLPQELVDRVAALGGARETGHLPNPAGIGGSFTPLDPDLMKLALFEMAEQAGVELWLHTTLLDAIVDAERVTGVRVHNKSGISELGARVVIDATGDADVAVRAGAEYVQDTPEAALNATLLFRVAGVDTDAFIADARREPHKIVLLADPYLREVKKLTPRQVMDRVRDIYDCPYIYLANVVRDYVPRSEWGRWEITGEDKAAWGRLKPFAARFSIMPLPHRRDVVTLNATSITFDATDGAQRSRAEAEGLRQMRLALEVLQRHVPGFAGGYLHTVLPAVSIRASRRVCGEYALNRDDVERGARFADGIARGSYPMSVQSAARPGVREHLFVRDGGDYDIPYRCLVPRRIDGLLTAGRCLSATREAVGSARMGAQCMAYGQAAGTAAALAARDGVAPRAIAPAALRAALERDHAIV
jgi:2-polyprenyl-6-methoxyphenol hydroxylase-like FAD-dependent oxidoreductase